MAPCVVKDLVEGSSSHACGGISPGDILLSVDNVPVLHLRAKRVCRLAEPALRILAKLRARHAHCPICVQVQGMSVDEIAGLIIGEAGTKVVSAALCLCLPFARGYRVRESLCAMKGPWYAVCWPSPTRGACVQTDTRFVCAGREKGGAQLRISRP